jgi:hypothetical protein
MSVSTEVQRTLVKSPPELWSELSNPEALARHLSELGEIRITSVEPETKVEWEAEGASGVVHLKQSGWGTKVTLSVTRAAPAGSRPEPAITTEADPEPLVEPEPIVAKSDPEPIAAETEPEPAATVEPDPEPAAVEPEPVPPPELEPQLGFFARLFRRRRARPIAVADPGPESTAAVDPEVEPDPEPARPRTGEVVALAAPEPIYPAPPLEPVADLAAELASVEAQMAEKTKELLTGVLDRLGAAHHRPFSRG